jgi:hypothetical protein
MRRSTEYIRLLRRLLCISLSALWLLTAASDQITTACDCGVDWRNFGAPAAESTSPYPIHLGTKLSLLTYSGGTRIPVNTAAQAKWICYHDLNCNGFLFETPQSGLTYAYFFGYTRPSTAPTGLSNTVGLSSAFLPFTSIYYLRRNELYRCASMALDEYYYYFGNSNARRSLIEELYCPYTLYGNGGCCWHRPETNTTTTCTNPNPVQTDPALQSVNNSNWKTSAALHWNSVGFTNKLPPNADCELTPLLWDPTGNCAVHTPGCFLEGGIPCGEHGYCTVNSAPRASILYVGPNYCDCHYFTGTNELGLVVFGGIQKYMGNACQYATQEFCANPLNPNLICSNHASRCVPSLLSGTSGLTVDYSPFCDCDAAPAISSTGRYCEINRCDTVYQCNGPFGAFGGTCDLNPLSSTWECACGVVSTGDLCQYSAATCKDDPTDIAKCNGRGVCMPPGLSALTYPTSTNPNYDSGNSWCQCTAELAHGSHCQLLNCDENAITKDRGRCEPTTGTFIECYPSFKTSGLPGTKKCDRDLCSETGGSSNSTAPGTCNCGKLLRGADVGSANDPTCYPRCPKLNGVECGAGAGSEINVCQYTGQGTTSHYAECQCGFGFIAVDAQPSDENDFSTFGPPPGKSIKVCEPWCKHGAPPSSWTPTNLLACVCPNTGFTTNAINGVPQNPRCDEPVCKNGGTWDPSAHQCVCRGPYSPESNCAVNTCDDPHTSYIEGTVAPSFLLGGTPICSCKAPYRPVNELVSRKDCAAHNCGPYGTPNPLQTALTTPVDMCVCQPVLATHCDDHTGLTCSFCSLSLCQNGGVLTITGSVASCTCPFPWNAGSIHCEQHQCVNGHPGSGVCVCNLGWTGSTCNTLVSAPLVVPSSTGAAASPSSSGPRSSTGGHGGNATHSSSTGHTSSSTGVPKPVKSDAYSDNSRVMNPQLCVLLCLFVYLTCLFT